MLDGLDVMRGALKAVAAAPSLMEAESSLSSSQQRLLDKDPPTPLITVMMAGGQVAGQAKEEAKATVRLRSPSTWVVPGCALVTRDGMVQAVVAG